MSFDWNGIATVAAVVLGGGGLGALVRAKAPKGVRENDIIDQIQEERDKDRGRIATLEERLDASVGRERLRDDYILLLRQHIAEGKKPPPPPYPAALLSGSQS